MNSAETVAGNAGHEARKGGAVSPHAGDETAGEMSMNAVTAADARAARVRAQTMFHCVLAGWASDVLRLERERRLGRHWPGLRAQGERAAA